MREEGKHYEDIGQMGTGRLLPNILIILEGTEEEGEMEWTDKSGRKGTWDFSKTSVSNYSHQLSMST